MKDNFSASVLTIGDSIREKVFALKSIEHQGEVMAGYLTDKTGEIPFQISAERFNPSMKEMIGGAVKVSGVVLNGKNMAPYIKVKALEKAAEGEYKPSDLFTGLDEAHVTAYKKIIQATITKIPDPEIQKYVKATLSADVLDTLARFPATCGYHGRYQGGALASTALVSKIAVQAGVQYQKWGNGLYSSPLDWSVLLAATLLHMAAVPEYIVSGEPPFKKSRKGIERGYISCLQSVLEEAPLDDEKLSRILNCLGAAVPMKTAVKATSAEGVLLRHCLLMYEELDMLDAGRAEDDSEEDEYFDPRLHRYVTKRKEGEVGA